MTGRWLLPAALTLSLLHAGNTFAGLPALIPREILFGNPERLNPQISPDGKYLAYLAPDKNNVLQVWLRTVGQQDDKMMTADKKRGIYYYGWPYDGEHLAYVQDSDGDENWHFYTVHLQSGIVRDMTPFQGIQARSVAADPKFPHEGLVSMNLNDRHKHDVYHVDGRTGAIELDTENPGTVMTWIADAQFKVRAAMAATPDGGHDLLVRTATDKPWQTLRHWGPDDRGDAVSFSADGTTLYIVGSHDANAVRLVAVEVATGKETVMAEDPQYDVVGVVIHPTTRGIQAVALYKDKLEWQVLDPSIAADFAALAKLHKGEFSIIDRFLPPGLAGLGRRDLADKTWIVSYVTDDGPVYYYAYDRGTKTGTLLFTHQPKLEGVALAPMQPIAFQSRDGLTIHGYLTGAYQNSGTVAQRGASGERRRRNPP